MFLYRTTMHPTVPICNQLEFHSTKLEYIPDCTKILFESLNQFMMQIYYLFRVAALDGFSFCFLCAAVNSEKRLSEAMVESWALGYFLLWQWKSLENLRIIIAKENLHILFSRKIVNLTSLATDMQTMVPSTLAVITPHIPKKPAECWMENTFCTCLCGMHTTINRRRCQLRKDYLDHA